MKRILLWLAFGFIVAALAVGILWLRKPAPKAADLLPDSCLIFADIPNLPESQAQLAQTAIAALWREPEVRAFLEKPLLSLRASVNLDEIAANLQRIADDIRGEAFLAVTHVRVLPTLDVGLVFGADFGRDQIKARAVLAYYEHLLQKKNPGLKVETKSYLGVKYTLWTLAAGSPICHTFINSLAVFTLGEDTMRDVIARHTGHAKAPGFALAASKAYRNITDRMPAGYEGLVFLNTEQVMKLVGPLLALSPQTAGVAQELARIQSAGTSVTFLGDTVEDVTFVSFRAPRTKSLPPLQRKTLALTTPQTLLYVAGSPDLAGLCEQALQAMPQSGKPELATAAARFAQALQRQGIRLQEDVFGALGPEVALIAGWRAESRFPEVALVAEVRDAARLRSSLPRFVGAIQEAAFGDSQMPWEESSVSGQTLRTMRVGDGTIAPTYVTTDQFFILALTSDFSRELLAQTAGSKPTLADSDVYRQAMKRLPERGVAYSYCDLRALWERSYPLTAALPILGAGKLPNRKTVARHLFPFASVSIEEERGDTRLSFSPFSPTVMLAGGVVAAVGYARSEMIGVSPHAPRTSSDTGARPVPPENPSAASQNPSPQ